MTTQVSHDTLAKLSGCRTYDHAVPQHWANELAKQQVSISNYVWDYTNSGDNSSILGKPKEIVATGLIEIVNEALAKLEQALLDNARAATYCDKEGTILSSDEVNLLVDQVKQAYRILMFGSVD